MPARFHRAALLAALAAVLLLIAQPQALAQERASGQRVVDARYAPTFWHTGISFPDDWHKALVDERGRLLYDFGPGPYVTPKTTLTFGLAGHDLEATGQTLESQRFPLATTTYEAEGVAATVTAFSAYLDDGSAVPSPPTDVVRLEGTVGSPGWADPPEGSDPAFRSAAWGPNRPVRYRLAVPPGSRQVVAMGFAEGHRTREGQRQLRLHVEGAEPVEFDPIAQGERNQPQVVLFDARDADGDGFISAESASAESDPNTFLSALWVFSPRERPDPAAIIAGDLNDRALHYVNAGRDHEPFRRARVDVLQLDVEARDGGDVTPTLEITTQRSLEVSSGGILLEEGVPFVVTRPAATSAERTERGWLLRWPEGTRMAQVLALHGPHDARIGPLPHRAALLNAAREEWRDAIPYGTITISDEGIQRIVDASVRTLYQSRDVVDGEAQFQPGMALYRGLWVHDAAYFIETALLLGDIEGARVAIERVLDFQQPTGRIKVMRPLAMNRETALALWTASRYARITGDDAWLRGQWDHIARGADFIGDMRASTMDDPSAPYYGLMPPSFADGGVGGVEAEYSAVYWSLTALEAVIQDAERLGLTERLPAWRALFTDLRASWEQAAARDLRRTEDGYPYLPVRIGDTTENEPPPQAQWMIVEAATFSDHLAPDDTLVTGTLEMLKGHDVQGIPLGVGWVEDGIWAYSAAFFAHLHLIRGERERFLDLLYAFANHSTPHGGWVEEQKPKHVSSRTAGDYPHAWASAFFVRLARHALASERDQDLALLDGVPAQWLAPGARLALDAAPSEFGPITLEAKVHPYGTSASVSIEPIGEAGQGGTIRFNLRPFRTLGYLAEDGSELPEEMTLPWGESTNLRFVVAR